MTCPITSWLVILLSTSTMPNAKVRWRSGKLVQSWQSHNFWMQSYAFSCYDHSKHTLSSDLSGFLQEYHSNRRAVRSRIGIWISSHLIMLTGTANEALIYLPQIAAPMECVLQSPSQGKRYVVQLLVRNWAEVIVATSFFFIWHERIKRRRVTQNITDHPKASNQLQNADVISPKTCR